MNIETALNTARECLASWTAGTNLPEPNRVDVIIEADDLVAAVTALVRAEWGYLTAITGLDAGVEAGLIEVLYHFCQGAAIVTLRVRTPRQNAVVPTVCDVIPSARLYERELSEMLGVEVQGALTQGYLFLPDEWQKGLYPLRKDAVLT